MAGKSTPDKELNDEQKRGKAYNNATNTLRDAHRQEFNTLMVAEAKALGIEWKPRLTEEEKAAEKIKSLLAEHPEIDLASLTGTATEPPPA